MDRSDDPSEESERAIVNPFAIGAGFLAHCIRKGWVLQEGKGGATRYYVTAEGREELARGFGIDIRPGKERPRGGGRMA